MDDGTLPGTGIEQTDGLGEGMEEEPARARWRVVPRDVDDEVAAGVGEQVELAVTAQGPP